MIYGQRRVMCDPAWSTGKSPLRATQRLRIAANVTVGCDQCYIRDSSRLRKNFGSRRFWEVHEFHSCRNCCEINSGFQPLGGTLRGENLLARIQIRKLLL